MTRRLCFHAVHRMLFLLVVLLGAQIGQTAVADKNATPDERLVGRIDYWFVGHLGQTDDAGRLLVWEATIEGDVNGKMKWWFIDPPPIVPIKSASGETSFYAARWELWNDDKLLLAGETAGKTFFSDGEDGIWDGHGRVTEASGKFVAIVGHTVYESGPVFLGEDPPRTLSGTGMFLVY